MTMERHGHDAPDAGELSAEIRRQDRRLTSQRQAILDALRRHPHPMTNKQIHAAMGEGCCDLATIYRSMKLLVELGLVERFDFGDGVARFELARHHAGGHHHHLICTRCQRVYELDECFPEEFQRRIAERYGFTEVTHKLEFFGICAECRNGSSKSREPRECGCP